MFRMIELNGYWILKDKLSKQKCRVICCNHLGIINNFL